MVELGDIILDILCVVHIVIHIFIIFFQLGHLHLHFIFCQLGLFFAHLLFKLRDIAFDSLLSLLDIVLDNMVFRVQTDHILLQNSVDLFALGDLFHRRIITVLITLSVVFCSLRDFLTVPCICLCQFDLLGLLVHLV